MTDRNDDLQVLLTGRQAGKTSKLMDWLLEGEKVLGWPHWSRGIIVPAQDRADWMVREFPVHRNYLHHMGVDIRNLLTGPEYRGRRDVFRDTEFAVDDAEAILSRYLGLRPSVLTMTGVPFADPNEIPEQAVSPEEA